MKSYPATGDRIEAHLYSDNGGHWEHVEVVGKAYSHNGGLLVLVKELEAADEGERCAGEHPIHAIPALFLLREKSETGVQETTAVITHQLKKSVQLLNSIKNHIT
jgi:hypothetical protein